MDEEYTLADLAKSEDIGLLDEAIEHFSVSGALLVGSRPQHGRARSHRSVVPIIGEHIGSRFKQLERERNDILWNILTWLYGYSNILHQNGTPVTDYLTKVEMLVGSSLAPDHVKELILRVKPTSGEDLVRDIEAFQQAVSAYRGSEAPIGGQLERDVLAAMEAYPVDLTYHFSGVYIGDDPHIAVAKTKHPYRIVDKITRYILEGFWGSSIFQRLDSRRRKKNQRDIPWNDYMKGMKAYLLNGGLEEGRLRDIFGIQIVAHEKSQLQRIATYLKSDVNCPEVEVGGIETHDQKSGPYNAIHMDVAWNPLPVAPLMEGLDDGERRELLASLDLDGEWERRSVMGNSNIDTIEVILMGVPQFFDANFGEHSYWHRMQRQKFGVVTKEIRHGGLHTRKYRSRTDVRWKVRVERRMLNILKYTNPDLEVEDYMDNKRGELMKGAQK